MSATAHTDHGHHHKESFITKYIFSQDHKMIGKQFLVTAIFMACVAVLLSVLFRIQIGWPGESSMCSFVFSGRYLGTQWNSSSGDVSWSGNNPRNDHGILCLDRWFIWNVQ
jgi:hypothetical protein